MPALTRPRAPVAKPGFLCLGYVRAPHGLKGEVIIKSFTADPLAVGRYVGLQTLAGQPVVLTQVRPHKLGLLARVEGVTARTAAEALVGTALYLPVTALPPAAPGEIYLASLTGLEVRWAATGLALGQVDRVFDNGAQAVVVVVLVGQEVLIPLVADYLTYDAAAGVLWATPAAQELVDLAV